MDEAVGAVLVQKAALKGACESTRPKKAQEKCSEDPNRYVEGSDGYRAKRALLLTPMYRRPLNRCQEGKRPPKILLIHWPFNTDQSSTRPRSGNGTGRRGSF